MMENVIVTRLHPFMLKNETLNPGRATTKEKDRFSPRTSSKVGNFNHPKLGTIIFTVFDFEGKQYILVLWFESLHFAARSFARSTRDNGTRQPDSWWISR